MTPAIDLRITSMIRAMEDVVRPAIDPLDSLAREQAALVVGHLRLLAIQWSKADRYARVCLADLETALEGLEPSGGPATRAAAADLAQVRSQARAQESDAEAHYKAVMRATDSLVRAAARDGEGPFRDALGKAVLGFSTRQSLRDRSWFAASGFDLNPGELRSIEELTMDVAR